MPWSTRTRNLVLVTGEAGGETGYSGFGAGGGPTAVAVLSDLIGIAERGHASQPARLTDVHIPAEVTDRSRAPYYLRFVVRDRPGIIAGLATALARNDINIDAVLQDFPVNKYRALQAGEQFAVTETFKTGEQYGFAVAQDNPKLVAALDAALAKLRETGGYDAIYKAWFGNK